MRILKNVFAALLLWAMGPVIVVAATGSWNGVAFTALNGVAQTSWNGTSISCASGSTLISKIAGSEIAAGSTNSNGFNTGAVFNANGGNFICGVISYLDFGTTPTISDGTNTFSYTTIYSLTTTKMRFFYCPGATCSNGMTLTVTGNGTFPSIVAVAFSNVKTASPFDADSGGNVSGLTSVQAGSVTPSNDNQLLLFGFNGYVLNETINLSGTGWTKLAQKNSDGSNNVCASLAYKIQTTAGPENPTWSWTTPSGAVANIGSFKNN